MSFTGTWKLTMKTPMGERNGGMELVENNSILTGNMTSDQGELEIANGIVKGNTASWVVKATQPIQITLSFTAQPTETGIEGTIKFGLFGSGSFVGTRA